MTEQGFENNCLTITCSHEANQKGPKVSKSLLVRKLVTMQG